MNSSNAISIAACAYLNAQYNFILVVSLYSDKLSTGALSNVYSLAKTNKTIEYEILSQLSPFLKRVII